MADPNPFASFLPSEATPAVQADVQPVPMTDKEIAAITPKEVSATWSDRGELLLTWCAYPDRHQDGGACDWDLGPNATTPRLMYVVDVSGQHIPDESGGGVQRAPESRRSHVLWARQEAARGCRQMLLDRAEGARQKAVADAAKADQG